VAYVDPYGNEFVDVPINVTPYNKTSVVFDGLEILYNYAFNIDKNPVTGDLTSALTELTSPKPGSVVHVYSPSSYSGSKSGHKS
jgi:hypothetical protein